MRARLCYLALVLVPLVVYATAVFGEFGTPADFQHLDAAAREHALADQSRAGILNGALLDISFGFLNAAADFRYVRGLSVFLLILCGLALWQMLERGGWSEFDAAAAALSVVLLPSAQLAAGWGTSWPATLAALLSLAGFAAMESELEQGGRRLAVAMLGGVLLYFGAAMCYFPGALMALVPITAIGLVRPPRLWTETRKWFFSHLGLLLAALFAAWLLERKFLSEAGVADAGTFTQRVVELVTHGLPLAGAPFIAATSGPLHILCAVMALVVAGGLFLAVRQRSREEPRLARAWQLILGGVVVTFCLAALLSPGWRSSYRSLWPLAGVAVVALVAAVRGLSEQTGSRPIWHHAAMGGIVLVGALAAFGQVHGLIVDPLTAEWNALRSAVLRASFPADAKVRLVRAETEETRAAAEAHFDARVAESTTAAVQMFHSAIRVRYPSGLPKGQRYDVQVAPAGAAPAPGAVVFDLTGGR